MPKPIVKVDGSSSELVARFAKIREEYKVPGDFPPEVSAEASTVAAQPIEMPERDETGIEFLTIDPVGSMDLDQALHIERAGNGFRVRYAIACLPAFVAPGGAIDAEARRRGQTVYSPDQRNPLHPPELSEGAASLLEGQERPAYIWDMQVDSTGEGTAVKLYRARVKSRNRLDYDSVQKMIDGGTDDQRLVLLKEVGLLRIAREAARGGANLPIPDQEVEQQPDGTYAVRFRPPLPVEDWNAQISLMTGMAAAELMIKGKVGILRTMPPAEESALNRFRKQAQALGVPWPEKQNYGEFLRSLDRSNPAHLALIYSATSLFRGAGYTPFDGSVPDNPVQSAVASTYAHVTAPLRRLVDRFGLAICEAISAGTEVPAWAREALPQLPEIMKASDQLSNGVSAACTNATEAAMLAHRIGEDFPAVIVEKNEKGVEIQVTNPAIVAKADGSGEPGTTVTAKLTTADIATSAVTFTVAG